MKTLSFIHRIEVSIRFALNPRLVEINNNIHLQSFALVLLLLVILSTQADGRNIVINEIMYHPPNDLENLQYVELFNCGNTPVDLSNWSFSKGIKYTFPVGTTVAPGGYVVVCRDLDAFVKIYVRKIMAFGNFDGRLSHQGETIQLSDSQNKVIDAVKYSDSEPWPVGADGYSSSLERISPLVESQRADNWAASRLPAKVSPKGTPGKQNDNYSVNLPPTIKDVDFSPKCPSPGQAVTVHANVSDSDGLTAVTLLYRIAKPGHETAETEMPMKRVSGETYKALIPGQPDRHLVRFRIKAVDSKGIQRIQPSENEPRWTYSYYTYANTERGNIPFGFIVHVDETEYYATMREGNRELEEMIRITMNLEDSCFHQMVSIDLETERLEKVKNIYREAFEEREKFIQEAMLTDMKDIRAPAQKSKRSEAEGCEASEAITRSCEVRSKAINQKLSDQIRQTLTDKQYAQFKEKQAGRNTQPR